MRHAGISIVAALSLDSCGNDGRRGRAGSRAASHRSSRQCRSNGDRHRPHCHPAPRPPDCSAARAKRDPSCCGSSFRPVSSSRRTCTRRTSSWSCCRAGSPSSPVRRSTRRRSRATATGHVHAPSSRHGALPLRRNGVGRAAQRDRPVRCEIHRSEGRSPQRRLAIVLAAGSAVPDRPRLLRSASGP